MPRNSNNTIMFSIILNVLLLALLIMFIGLYFKNGNVPATTLISKQPAGNNKLVAHEERPQRPAKRPITYATQRVDPFERIGYLYNDGDGKHKMLPLFGRRTYARSTTWNYFTSSQHRHSVKIPLEVKNRSCMDRYGCAELYDDDILFVPEYESEFKVKLYNLYSY